MSQPGQTAAEREMEQRLIVMQDELTTLTDDKRRARLREEYRKLHAEWMESRRQPRLGDVRS